MAFQYYTAPQPQQQSMYGLQANPYATQQQGGQGQQGGGMEQMGGLLAKAKDTGLLDKVTGMFGGGSGATMEVGSGAYSLTGAGSTAGNVGGGTINSGAYSLMGEGAGMNTGGYSLLGEGGASVGGSGGSAAGGSGGMSGAAVGGIVAAAIAAQYYLTTDNDTEFEGVTAEGGAFEGKFGAEPWLAWAHDKMDLEPTAGTKFDSAVKNEDWGLAFERSFEMSDYWADPGSSWAESAASGLGLDEEVSGWAFNPMGELTGGLGDAIGRWF